MNNRKRIILILAISWLCFLGGCLITIAYLHLSTQAGDQAQSAAAVQAMQMQKEEDESIDADELSASIRSFLNSFYQNLLEGNGQALMQMVEDPDSFYSTEQLQKIESYVEAYENVHYYIETSSVEEGSVIVFVSYRTKLYDIETTVPGLAHYYIKNNDQGWLVCNNEEHLSEAALREMKASLQSGKIRSLIRDIHKQYEAALETDETLKEYFEEQK